jgi:hypothetical protein
MATPQVATPAAKAPPNEFLDASVTTPPSEDVVVDTNDDVTIEVAPESTETEVEAKPEPKTPEVEPEVEQEARSSGWVSKDEWLEAHGSDKGWKSASDYVEFRRNFLPIISKENKELRKRLEQLERERATERTQQEQAKAQLAREQLRLEMRAAREDGDWDKVDALTEKLLDLRVAEKPKPAPGPVPIDPEVQRDYNEFAKRNPWLNTDKRLTKVFAIQLKGIMDTGAADSIPEAFEDAKDLVKRMYPEKFLARKAMAESGGESGTNNRTTRSWSQLKPDVRASYENFLEDNPKVKKEDLLRRFPADFFRG